jgi:hypothetical protein
VKLPLMAWTTVSSFFKVDVVDYLDTHLKIIFQLQFAEIIIYLYSHSITSSSSKHWSFISLGVHCGGHMSKFTFHYSFPKCQCKVIVIHLILMNYSFHWKWHIFVTFLEETIDLNWVILGTVCFTHVTVLHERC